MFIYRTWYIDDNQRWNQSRSSKNRNQKSEIKKFVEIEFKKFKKTEFKRKLKWHSRSSKNGIQEVVVKTAFKKLL